MILAFFHVLSIFAVPIVSCICYNSSDIIRENRSEHVEKSGKEVCLPLPVNNCFLPDFSGFSGAKGIGIPAKAGTLGETVTFDHFEQDGDESNGKKAVEWGLLRTERKGPFDESEDFGLLSRHAAQTGIHLILATQRPSANVITKEIKACIPCRTAFVVVDEQESKIIIDRSGAERLTGHGDMIFTRDRSGEGVHGQAAFVSFAEIDQIIDFVRNEKGLFGNEPIIQS